jgi:glutathione peroxidase
LAIKLPFNQNHLLWYAYFFFHSSSSPLSAHPAYTTSKCRGWTGGTIDLAKYKGKKILIVNTASKCGFTPQYADLEKLYVKYQDKLVIIGFPCQ